MKRVIIFYILLIGMTASLSAQLKIGYILSERIRGEYEEFKEAESQLQLEYRKVQFEFDQRVKKLDSLKQKLEKRTGFHFALSSKKGGAGSIAIKFNNEAEFNDVYEFLMKR